MKKTSIELFGWIATACLLAAYFANSAGILSGQELPYQALNLVGGLGIMSVSAYKKAWQPALVNVFWSIIAIASIARILL